MGDLLGPVRTSVTGGGGTGRRSLTGGCRGAGSRAGKEAFRAPAAYAPLPSPVSPKSLTDA